MNIVFSKKVTSSVFALSLLASPVALMPSLAQGAEVSALENAPTSFADLVDQVMPAVVNISTTQVIEEDNRSRNISPFEEFFGEQFNLPQFNQGPREAQALGSGFIISKDGYIVTNNHVIDGADEIKVITHDGKEMVAKVVGTDSQTDVALLKVDEKNLPFVSFGSSEDARVGDWVIAIGNPFGFGGTVTKGIISARGRNIGSGPYDDFIQVDAPINRGNSGGPLFNMQGQVIGVNTAIISPTGGSIGLGFSVPSSIVENIVKHLQTEGKVKRGWLGVQIQEVSKDLAKSLGLDEAKGALVSDLIEGPAEGAGIQQGDVIIKFNDKDVKDSKMLPRLVAATPVGTEAKIVVVRDGKEVELTVKLDERKEDVLSRGSTASNNNEASLDSTGLSIQELDAEARQRYGIATDINGVLVSKVKPLSAASKAGLVPGSVIVEMNKKEMKNPNDVAEEYLKAKDDGRESVLMLVHQAGADRYLALPIAQDEEK
ncbi:MAG: DegQ family serine endoprotease [Alphaproteobacteria bacterium]